MNNKNLLLLCGLILICVGLIKPNINNFLPINESRTKISINTPENNDIKQAAQTVSELMKNSGASSVKADSAQLRDLYINLANMISLDGKDTVITTTEEIKKANSISGHLLQASGVDLKGKYVDLAKRCQDVVIAGISDDNVALSPELRKKAVESFMALAWAFNQTSR